jgi:hypothetical protein
MSTSVETITSSNILSSVSCLVKNQLHLLAGVEEFTLSLRPKLTVILGFRTVSLTKFIKKYVQHLYF